MDQGNQQNQTLQNESGRDDTRATTAPSGGISGNQTVTKPLGQGLDGGTGQTNVNEAMNQSLVQTTLPVTLKFKGNLYIDRDLETYLSDHNVDCVLLFVQDLSNAKSSSPSIRICTNVDEPFDASKESAQAVDDIITQISQKKEWQKSLLIGAGLKAMLIFVIKRVDLELSKKSVAEEVCEHYKERLGANIQYVAPEDVEGLLQIIHCIQEATLARTFKKEKWRKELQDAAVNLPQVSVLTYPQTDAFKHRRSAINFSNRQIATLISIVASAQEVEVLQRLVSDLLNKAVEDLSVEAFNLFVRGGKIFSMFALLWRGFIVEAFAQVTREMKDRLIFVTKKKKQSTKIYTPQELLRKCDFTDKEFNLLLHFNMFAAEPVPLHQELFTSHYEEALWNEKEFTTKRFLMVPYSESLHKVLSSLGQMRKGMDNVQVLVIFDAAERFNGEYEQTQQYPEGQIVLAVEVTNIVGIFVEQLPQGSRLLLEERVKRSTPRVVYKCRVADHHELFLGKAEIYVDNDGASHDGGFLKLLRGYFKRNGGLKKHFFLSYVLASFAGTRGSGGRSRLAREVRRSNTANQANEIQPRQNDSKKKPKVSRSRSNNQTNSDQREQNRENQKVQRKKRQENAKTQRKMVQELTDKRQERIAREQPAVDERFRQHRLKFGVKAEQSSVGNVFQGDSLSVPDLNKTNGIYEAFSPQAVGQLQDFVDRFEAYMSPQVQTRDNSSKSTPLGGFLNSPVQQQQRQLRVSQPMQPEVGQQQFSQMSSPQQQMLMQSMNPGLSGSEQPEARQRQIQLYQNAITTGMQLMSQFQQLESSMTPQQKSAMQQYRANQQRQQQQYQGFGVQPQQATPSYFPQPNSSPQRFDVPQRGRQNQSVNQNFQDAAEQLRLARQTGQAQQHPSLNANLISGGLQSNISFQQTSNLIGEQAFGSSLLPDDQNPLQRDYDGEAATQSYQLIGDDLAPFPREPQKVYIQNDGFAPHINRVVGKDRAFFIAGSGATVPLDTFLQGRGQDDPELVQLRQYASKHMAWSSLTPDQQRSGIFDHLKKENKELGVEDAESLEEAMAQGREEALVRRLAAEAQEDYEAVCEAKDTEQRRMQESVKTRTLTYTQEDLKRDIYRPNFQGGVHVGSLKDSFRDPQYRLPDEVQAPYVQERNVCGLHAINNMNSNLVVKSQDQYTSLYNYTRKTGKEDLDFDIVDQNGQPIRHRMKIGLAYKYEKALIVALNLEAEYGVSEIQAFIKSPRLLCVELSSRRIMRALLVVHGNRPGVQGDSTHALVLRYNPRAMDNKSPYSLCRVDGDPITEMDFEQSLAESMEESACVQLYSAQAIGPLKTKYLKEAGKRAIPHQKAQAAIDALHKVLSEHDYRVEIDDPAVANFFHSTHCVGYEKPMTKQAVGDNAQASLGYHLDNILNVADHNDAWQRIWFDDAFFQDIYSIKVATEEPIPNQLACPAEIQLAEDDDVDMDESVSSMDEGLQLPETEQVVTGALGAPQK